MAKFGVGMVCSFHAGAAGMLRFYLYSAGANAGAFQRRGTTLRFPSLALSRSGTKGISHPERIPGPLAKREFSTSARRPARKWRAAAPLDLSFGPWAPTIRISTTL